MRKSKHDMIIDKLVNRLYHSQIPYHIIEREKEYDIYSGKHGECDVYAVYKDNLLLFEVKTNNTRKNRYKAYNQLEKDVLYFNRLFKPHKIFKFYVYGSKNNYKIERVKLRF